MLYMYVINRAAWDWISVDLAFWSGGGVRAVHV